MIRSANPSIQERIEWRQPDCWPGVHILVVDNCARRWQVFHETYDICTGLALEGPSLEWKYRGKRQQIYSPDSLMLMEPGEVHATTSVTPPASFRVLFIEPSVIERAAEELGLGSSTRPHFKVAQVSGCPLHRAFVALHGSLERSSTILERESRFAACLHGLLEQCAESGARTLLAPVGNPVNRRARAFLAEHVADPIRLEQLAAAAGAASRFQLVRAFTAEEGVPPHAFQIRLRIARAQRLLAAGIPVAQLSAELGFADQSHFGRHFRHVLGVTPAAFARAMAVNRRTRTY
jgi:AraC-like DNA-binding protein